jgi:hypothetical protein
VTYGYVEKEIVVYGDIFLHLSGENEENYETSLSSDLTKVTPTLHISDTVQDLTFITVLHFS